MPVSPDHWIKFEEINAALDMADVCKFLGMRIEGDRTTATWRESADLNVQINKTHLYDHVEGKSITPINLGTMAWGVDRRESAYRLAQAFGIEILTVAEHFGRAPQKDSWYEKKLKDGWEEESVYTYTDIEGTDVFAVHKLVRSHGGKRQKTFMQRDIANGRWSVKALGDLPLYNLTRIQGQSTVVIVEGEKDADALIASGWPATTCSGGTKKFLEHHVKQVIDTGCTDVWILTDNDETGRLHGQAIALEFVEQGLTVRMCAPSNQPKGDVSDYLADGGDLAELFRAISKSSPVVADDLEDRNIIEAKKANESGFANYLKVKTSGKPDHVAVPVATLVSELRTRFLGFPRRIGDALFDHDRDTGRIEWIHDHHRLDGWILAKSGHSPDFRTGRGSDGTPFVTMRQLFEHLRLQENLSEICPVPSWPVNPQAYYSHPKMPAPSIKRNSLHRLLDLFEPESENDRILIEAFYMTPLWNGPHGGRPLFILDSEMRGSGKTQMVQILADLYGAPMVPYTARSIESEELAKSLVTSSGRLCRVALWDNATGALRSDTICTAVTAKQFVGRAPYAREEQVRPNNLTWAITGNAIQADDDLTARSMNIRLLRPKYDAKWADKVGKIMKNRLQIMSDIRHSLSIHEPFDVDVVGRFPVWERNVLQVAAGSEDKVMEILELQHNRRQDMNADVDNGQDLMDFTVEELESLSPGLSQKQVFICSNVLHAWAKKHNAWLKAPRPWVASLVTHGYAPMFGRSRDTRVRIKDKRRRGYHWNCEGHEFGPGACLVSSQGDRAIVEVVM
jgi:5S rRNA maturation endonuclease (ribonuclease M5)